jgi:glycogen(starch) synthase
MTADAVGGVWTYALELARALAPHDVEVALATMGRAPDEAQRDELASVPNVTLFASEYQLEWMPDPWADVAHAGRWLQGLEREWEADVVHLNGYAHAALRWHAPTLVVAHSCVCSWWRAVHGEGAPADWSRYRDVVAVGLRAADLVLAPTRAMLDALAAEYGMPGAACVVHNGRAAHEGTASEKRPLVLSVGRLWDEAKNLRALEHVAPRLPWPVYVAGDAAPPSALAVDGRAPAAAHHLGRLSTAGVQRWMGAASIYALPARYEPFGLSALEAALAGCALVLGDIPSLRELWDGAALFVDPGDSGALERALLTLMHDAPLRATVAAAARERAGRYTPERMAAGYLAAYGALAPRLTMEAVACAS